MRFRVTPGSFASALLVTLTVLALPASPPATAGGSDPDGDYRGRFQDTDDAGDRGEVRLLVAQDGRLIRRFRASRWRSASTRPPSAGSRWSLTDSRRRKRPSLLTLMASNANGTKADPPSGAEQIYEISGRLTGRRIIAGRMVLEKRCSSEETFSAARRATRR